MDKEFTDVFLALNQKIDALNTLDEKEAEIKRINIELNEKLQKCAELQTALDEVNQKIQEMQSKNVELQSKITEIEKEKQLAELNSALNYFDEKDLVCAKELIEAYKASPNKVELNSIVQTVKAAKYDELMSRQSGIESEVNYLHNAKPLDNIDYSSLF